MLRHAHFYRKGGMQTFAAICSEVCFADKADLSLSRTMTALMTKNHK